MPNDVDLSLFLCLSPSDIRVGPSLGRPPQHCDGSSHGPRSLAAVVSAQHAPKKQQARFVTPWVLVSYAKLYHCLLLVSLCTLEMSIHAIA